MLARLSLTDFRNHADAVIEAGPGLVVLTGENGAGKTNVLEAVSLLAPGRGLRRAALSEMAREGGPGGFGVAARLLLEPLPFRGGIGEGPVSDSARAPQDCPVPNHSPEGEGGIALATGTLAAAPERRQVRVNGAPAAASALAEWLSILWLTPAMDRLFIEGASGRRQFLDRLVLALAPGHAVSTTRYEAAMRARNKLLASEHLDIAWLTALEAQMAEHGVALAEARAETVAALGRRLGGGPDGPFARAGLALEGWQGTATLARDLAASRPRDAAAGRTLIGPHRVDLRIAHLGKAQPAERCSTGEQKALLLGLILAHADLVAERTGRRPVLLLDEVAAHLDPRRRAALFARLEASGGQVWMTGTEAALFAEARATRFSVAEGQVAPV